MNFSGRQDNVSNCLQFVADFENGMHASILSLHNANKYIAPVTGASSALRRWQVGLDWTSRIFETVERVIALDQRLSKI